jgi:hypothetical protein
MGEIAGVDAALKVDAGRGGSAGPDVEVVTVAALVLDGQRAGGAQLVVAAVRSVDELEIGDVEGRIQRTSTDVTFTQVSVFDTSGT